MPSADKSLAQRRPPFEMVYRLIPSRFPPVGLFDSVSSPTDLEMVMALESRTNDRLSPSPRLDLVAVEDRRVGPGWTPVMSAFCHPNPQGSRFSDGTYGVYYCAAELETAIDETVYHRERFLRETNEGACGVNMRCYVGELQTKLHDGLKPSLSAAILDPDHYAAAQDLARALRASGAFGLTYPSVRRAGGRCAALFRPPAISPVRQAGHYRYEFDGTAITHVVRSELVRQR